jgi:hypothetical protein
MNASFTHQERWSDARCSARPANGWLMSVMLIVRRVSEVDAPLCPYPA